MSLDKIHQGEDYIKAFSRSVNKVVTPHTELTEVEVRLYIGDTELLKYSKTDKTGSGFIQLTTEPEDGKYTFKAGDDETTGWKADEIVEAEFKFVLVTGDVRKFRKELGKVVKMRA